MTIHYFKTLLFLFLSLNLFAEGELIVFVSNNGSEVDQSFQSNTLPKIKQFAADNDITFKVKDAHEGVPEGISTLPAIVYQNHLGRSVYVGRFNQEDKVINFVRTAKRIPQTKEELKLSLVQRGWLLQDAKSHIELKTKITGLAGTTPKKFDALEFSMESEIEVVNAMDKFKEEEEFEVAPTDRKFYANFYPYRAADGMFYVTTELYSQFHCHEPVYTTLDKPFKGTWKKKEEVFAKAAKDIQAQIQFHADNPENGDGFDPVTTEMPTKSWEELSCGLPAPPEGIENFSVEIELPNKWKVKGAVSKLDPMAAFTFPPPIDSYNGEVRSLTGTLTLDESKTLKEASGKFEVDLNSLTMGDPDLDESVKSMIGVETYPMATFAFEEMQPVENKELEFGEMQTAVASGKFTFKGKTIEKTVNAQITPILDDEGNPILQVSVSFSMSLNPFNIDGPDGPEPQRNTVKFMLHFLMENDN